MQGGQGYLVLRLLSTQPPLGAAEELRMELVPPREGAGGAGSSLGPKGKRGELLLGPVGQESPWLVGGQLGLVEALAVNTERPSEGD